VIPHAGADLAAENARLRRENERLRMEREILQKTLGSAEMNFRLTAAQREMFPVRVLCDARKGRCHCEPCFNAYDAAL
jgi:hypothetical protein